MNVERIALRALVKEIHHLSRGTAGSRTIVSKLVEKGTVIGRYKVRNLMNEAGLVSKQPGPHAYEKAKETRPDIPNHLEPGI